MQLLQTKSEDLFLLYTFVSESKKKSYNEVGLKYASCRKIYQSVSAILIWKPWGIEQIKNVDNKY